MPNAVKMLPFLKQILTGDKMWILYNNTDCKGFLTNKMKSSTNSSEGQFSLKENEYVYMVVLYYELFPKKKK